MQLSKPCVRGRSMSCDGDGYGDGDGGDEKEQGLEGDLNPRTGS